MDTEQLTEAMQPVDPITKALRERLKVTAVMLGHEPSTLLTKGVLAECDNIDAIHKALEQENADMRDFCERVEQAAQARENVTLWGVDYAPLPLDADGMPVHVGDMMDTSSFGTVEVEGFVHSAIAFYNYEDSQARLCTSPAKLCHRHKPTVADLLRDMLHDWFYADSEEEEAEIVERFAKRLQLADGDTE